MHHPHPGRNLITCVLAAICCFPSGARAGPPAGDLVDVALAAGLDFQQRSGTPEQRHIVDVKSTGAALLDVDGDGLLDIFFTSGSTIDRARDRKPGFGGRLFRNIGNLRFEDITEESGLPPLGWACGVAAADVDGNGSDDLFITCYGPDRLFLNRDGKFVEAQGSGLGGDVWSTGAAFGDLDGDGDLDLYVAGYLAHLSNLTRFDPAWEWRPRFYTICTWGVPDCLLEQLFSLCIRSGRGLEVNPGGQADASDVTFQRDGSPIAPRPDQPAATGRMTEAQPTRDVSRVFARNRPCRGNMVRSE